MPRNNPPTQQPVVRESGVAFDMWIKWFDLIGKAATYSRTDGSLEMVTLADADAANNSLYYSSDQNKLVYKDAGGTVNALY